MVLYYFILIVGATCFGGWTRTNHVQGNKYSLFDPVVANMVNEKLPATNSAFDVTRSALKNDSLPRTPRQIKTVSQNGLVTFAINVDQCRFAIFHILSTSKIKTFYLVDPRNKRFDENNLAKLNAEANKTTQNGIHYDFIQIKIPAILPGRWLIGIQADREGAVEVSAAIANQRRIEMKLDQYIHRSGEKFFLKAIFHDGAKPIKNAHLSVDVISSKEKQHTFLLFDDGRHGDGGGNDGVYSNGTVIDLPPGHATVLAKAKKGLTEREIEARIQIISGEQSSRLMGISGTAVNCKERNPCVEYQISAQIDFVTEAHYQISGYLHSLNEKFVANAFYSTMTIGKPVFGKHEITLHFSGQQILNSSLDGPYRLLLIVEQLDAHFNIVNKESFPNAYVTKSYLHTDFN